MPPGAAPAVRQQQVEQEEHEQNKAGKCTTTAAIPAAVKNVPADHILLKHQQN
jgi:hypothetical protein